LHRLGGLAVLVDGIRFYLRKSLLTFRVPLWLSVSGTEIGGNLRLQILAMIFVSAVSHASVGLWLHTEICGMKRMLAFI
jgi:hypothetical protein